MRPEEVTQNNMDGSARALQILGARFAGAWSELLAELQLSFLLFLLLASLPGLEEWKAGVCLLCSCGELMRSQPDNMAEFVRVLRRQLEQVSPALEPRPPSLLVSRAQTLRRQPSTVNR